MRRLLVAAAAAVLAVPAFAAEQKLDFILNWVPGGDHAPYYYAKKMGWYQKDGIDLNLEPGKGSALSTQRVGAGANPIGLADMAGVLVADGKGVDAVAVFNVYANSPQGMYWLKSSGIKGIKDFPGKKIGNPAGDAARVMWPALAKANGIDPNSVTWVNIDPNAKLAALKSHTIDITTSFYNLHHVFKRELGADMGFLAWRDAGLNTYGNSVIVNGEYLKKHRDTIAKFVKVTQRAFAACVKDPKPCVQALIDANGALNFRAHRLVGDFQGLDLAGPREALRRIHVVADRGEVPLLGEELLPLLAQDVIDEELCILGIGGAGRNRQRALDRHGAVFRRLVGHGRPFGGMDADDVVDPLDHGKLPGGERPGHVARPPQDLDAVGRRQIGRASCWVRVYI